MGLSWPFYNLNICMYRICFFLLMLNLQFTSNVFNFINYIINEIMGLNNLFTILIFVS